VPAGTAADGAIELARQIAANSPVAVRAARQAIRLGGGLGLAAALEVEDAAWRTAAMSADRREGIAAFAGKRPPVWPANTQTTFQTKRIAPRD
jgi:enoyl-CoA hydratase/carnithine racemase